MSAHSMDQIWAPIAAMQRAAVEAATFGHLAPKPQQTYDCRIVFAQGEYGDTIPVSVRSPGLPDSPWFFEDMMDYLLGIIYLTP